MNTATPDTRDVGARTTSHDGADTVASRRYGLGELLDALDAELQRATSSEEEARA
jgi:hypothetical protein